MAVYTKLDKSDMNALLGHYELGKLISFEGIIQGVSNSNYDLTTDKGHFVLTIFEPLRVDPLDVPYFLSLSAHMQNAGLDCPGPIETKNGQFFTEYESKPVAIVPFLEGAPVEPKDINEDHCKKIGSALAQFHISGGSFRKRLENRFGVAYFKPWFQRLASLPGLPENVSRIMQDEVDYLYSQWPPELPMGAIHGDLFPDNVFFQQGDVSGVIDMHFACTDFFAYDLSITSNAWCFNQNTEFVRQRFQALLEGYNKIRPLSQKEKDALPLLLRAAALRFLLSRYEEKLSYKGEQSVSLHNPESFLRRLEFFQNEFS
jgi:homoserine kinase type II